MPRPSIPSAGPLARVDAELDALLEDELTDELDDSAILELVEDVPGETITCDPAPSAPLPRAAASESTWSVASLTPDFDDDDFYPRGQQTWWRYTAVSAGLTALVCSLGFMLGGEPASVSAATPDPAPIVVAYDPTLLQDVSDAPGDVGTPDADVERMLARRVALRGARNLDAGRVRLARQAFEEALGHDPECRPALAGLGRIHFEAGHPRKAVEYLASAVRIEPRDAELQRMLAESYRAIGHSKSAARHRRLAQRHRD